MDDSTSQEPRADAFPLARKGYDRRQVDAYRDAIEARVEALEQHTQNLEGNMTELGLARPTDLAAELDVVGEEVKRILQEARVAAEQMRSRAGDDAARWRAEADEESRALRESSRQVAYEVRRSVWVAGSEMLASAIATSEAVTVQATERALFTQAGAEREASRLVGDARRERDESVGGAREEAERLIAGARQESESILSAARRQADAAQERARALELRRAELMAELEAARATIAGKETEPEPVETPDEPADEPAATVVAAEGPDDVRSHWPEDAGSVKIVSAARVMTTEPVDADAMVAEIEAMRETESKDLPAASPQPEASLVSPVASPQQETETETVDAPSASSPSGGGVDGGGQESGELPAASLQPEPESESEPEPELDAEERSDEQPTTSVQPESSRESPVASPQQEPEPDTVDAPSASSPSGGGVAGGDGWGQESGELPAASVQPESSLESPVASPQQEPETVDALSALSPSGGGVAEGDGGGQEPEPEAELEPKPVSEPEPRPDPLSGLFAQLRDPSDDGGAQESPESPVASPQPEPDPESGPSSVAPAAGRAGAEELSHDAGGSESSAPEPAPEFASEPSLDPFTLRERHLLPVQNRALRSVKRHLVEAQNRALEDLRLVEDWEPDANIVSDGITESLGMLARESLVAGFAAAAEMAEATETPQPEDVDPGDPSPEFAGALLEAAHGSVVRSRDSGAGQREVASSLSRVFRSWRTDEAERRVQFASRTAYHIGVAAALADLGVTDLAVSPSGRPCPECPANKGSWAVADGLPGGVTMPPARLECACTIVPSP